MNMFIDSKDNLGIFAKGVDEIGKLIEQGIEQYKESEELNKQLLDEVKN